MKVTISNIAGGNHHTCKSERELARIVVTRENYGGWELVSVDEDDEDDKDDVKSIVKYAVQAAQELGCEEMLAKHWQIVADRAIQIERYSEN